jgi:hypothetical protein
MNELVFPTHDVVFPQASDPLPESTSVVLERDLLRFLAMRAVQQMVLTWTASGWTVHVFLMWGGGQPFKLVSLHGQTRHYRGVDRLLRVVRKHGPLPPTLMVDH